jgi:NhaP-type Na+/H+ and K+/H+ antiporter
MDIFAGLLENIAVLGLTRDQQILVALAVGLAWLSFAVGTAWSAVLRGHGWLAWFVCGLFVGPLALCFALSLQDYRRGRS